MKEFSVDDKGCVFVVVFGLPPHRHTQWQTPLPGATSPPPVGAEDALRATLFAITVKKELIAMGLDVAIGIASGLCYFGGTSLYAPVFLCSCFPYYFIVSAVLCSSSTNVSSFWSARASRICHCWLAHDSGRSFHVFVFPVKYRST